jgi:hypothetical protein
MKKIIINLMRFVESSYELGINPLPIIRKMLPKKQVTYFLSESWVSVQSKNQVAVGSYDGNNGTVYYIQTQRNRWEISDGIITVR